MEDKTDHSIKIVVGVDFTEASDVAIDESLRYARWIEHDELHAVVVLEQLKDLEEMGRQLDLAHKKLRTKIAERMDRHDAREWTQEVVLHVRMGDPAEALHQVAVDYGAHMIVVGHHERTGLQKLFLGSAASKLMEIAKLPVLVARKNEIEGLAATERPEPPPLEGEAVRTDRTISERVSFGGRGSHVAGLV